MQDSIKVPWIWGLLSGKTNKPVCDLLVDRNPRHDDRKATSGRRSNQDIDLGRGSQKLVYNSPCALCTIVKTRYACTSLCFPPTWGSLCPQYMKVGSRRGLPALEIRIQPFSTTLWIVTEDDAPPDSRLYSTASSHERLKTKSATFNKHWSITTVWDISRAHVVVIYIAMVKVNSRYCARLLDIQLNHQTAVRVGS